MWFVSCYIFSSYIMFSVRYGTVMCADCFCHNNITSPVVYHRLLGLRKLFSPKIVTQYYFWRTPKGIEAGCSPCTPSTHCLGCVIIFKLPPLYRQRTGGELLGYYLLVYYLCYGRSSCLLHLQMVG